MTRLGWIVVAVLIGTVGAMLLRQLPLTGEDGWVLPVGAFGIACLVVDAIGAKRRARCRTR